VRKLTEIEESERADALDRYRLLQYHFEGGLPLASAAREAGIPLRTAQRWVAGYRAHGLPGLARQPRAAALVVLPGGRAGKAHRTAFTAARPALAGAFAQLPDLVAREDADDRRAVRAHDRLDAAVQRVISVERHPRKQMVD